MHLKISTETEGLRVVELTLPDASGGVRDFALEASFASIFPGWRGRVTLADGFFLTHVQAGQATRLSGYGEQSEPTVELSIHLQGLLWGQVDLLRGAFAVRGGDCHLVYAPQPRTRFDFRCDAHYEAFEVNFTVPYFTALAERYPEALEPHLDAIRREDLLFFDPRHLKVTPALRAVIHQIVRYDGGDALRRFFLETKASELLLLLLDAQGRAGSGERAACKTRRDVAAIHEARDLLLARTLDPPSLPELARAVGVNEYKLKRGFKEVFGQTAYGLLAEHRMQQARAYLLDSDQTVAEVAALVGYAHASHFSTAFKRMFGVTPGSLRSGRA